MIKIDMVPLADVIYEVIEHAERHREEIAKAAGLKDVEFDWEAYISAAENGQMACVTLRHDGIIVGYSVFLIGSNLRLKKELEAANHGIWVDKAYRKKFGSRMITDAVKFLERIGVTRSFYINDSKAFARLLKRSGYDATHTLWSLEHGK